MYASRSFLRSTSAAAVAAALVAACAALHAAPRSVQAERKGSYQDLLALFTEWRAFQRPVLIDGVPDYTARAMDTQRQRLPELQRRLAAIDPTGWPVPQQVDWHIVRAEMSGLDFDQRVLRPWANNPAFYVTVFASQSDQPAREGPLAWGAVEVWSYTFPLTPEQATRMDAGIRVVPKLLEQARTNLTGNGKDLWTFGARSLRQQSATLERLASRLGNTPGPLSANVRRAKEATDAFAAWVESQAASKTGSSGIGIEDYDWYLKHVQLVPFTWQDEVTLMERELARAHAFLALEEQRNASLPPQEPLASAEEHARRFPEAVAGYMTILRTRDLLTIEEWMEPALRARIGRFNPGPREFFSEVDYRDPMVMRTHGYHWFDLARMANAPHASPIRRGPLLYNVFVTRTEGLATGWEEMMLQAGMFDVRPRSRELIYVLLAQRAARALGDLKMQARTHTLEQAAQFAAANTPRGWLRLDATLVRWEQHLYLQQPAYGTSYLIGKIQIEMLMAERRRQLGQAFTLKRFMNELDAAGLIPASLIAWELTGVKPAHLAP